MGYLRAFNLGILLLVCINIILVGGGETEVINNVINLEYSLNIDLKNEVANDGVGTLENKHKFIGTINIKFEVVDDVKELELHCGKLVITEKPTLTWTQPGSIEENGKSLRIPTCDPHTHKMKIKNNFVSKITYKIYLEYDGHLRDDTKGLYHSTYRIPNDFIRHIYGADFLGDMAKYAFPHFGNNLEGKFYISIVHSPVYKVLSNIRSVKGLVKLPEKIDSPEVAEELVSEAIDSPLDESAFLYESRFVAVSTSPSKLSFLIGHFKETKVELPPSDDNLFNSISIWTKPEVEAEGMLFANSMIVSFFEFFQKYFLPLKSIDNFEIIALYDGPSYNPSNINKLGAVAFRESELRSLDGRDLSPERVLFVIESLANGMLTKFFDQIPKRVVWSRDAMIQNLIGVLVSRALNEEITLNAGSLIDGRMLETMEYDTLEIQDNIQEDSIVLYRESFVIRMLAMSLYENEDVFLSYLSQYFVNSRNPRYILPFWKYLTNEYFKKLGNGITAEGIIQSWNSSKHLHVLHVDQEGTDIVVKQKQYPKKIENIKENAIISEEDDKYSALDIPLTYTTIKELNFEETRPKFWLTGAQPKITLDNVLQDPEDCAIVNIQLIARVRVVYSKKNLACLIKFISADPTKIHELNVYQLVDDVFDAAWYGYNGTDYGSALELLKSLKNERRYIVWLAAYNAIMKLNNILKGTPIHGRFQELIRELIEGIYYDLFPYSIESEELLRSSGIPPKVQLRPLIFEIACVMNFPDAVLRAKTAFLKWVNEQYRIPEPFIYTVFSTAARQNIDKFVKILTDQYHTTPLRRQKTIVLLALGCYEEFTGKSRSHALQFLSNINVFQLKDLYDEIFKQPYTYSIAKNSLYLNLDTINAMYEKYPKVLENRERKFLRLVADNPHSHMKELSELDPAIWGKYTITEITSIADQYKNDRKRWMDLQYDEVALILTV